MQKKEKKKNTDSKGESVTYQFLEVYYPELRPAGLVSTPRRMLAQVLTVRLENKKSVISVYIYSLYYVCISCARKNVTSSLFVLSFEFLCREVGKVVVIKWVPCRLRQGVGGTSCALVLSCITNAELNRLGGAWLRCK